MRKSFLTWTRLFHQLRCTRIKHRRTGAGKSRRSLQLERLNPRYLLAVDV